MRYVKIREKSYNEAMMKLKMEYGEDAIPISHKYVKEGGLFKSALFAKDVVELTAAIQDKRPKKAAVPEKSRVDFTIGGKNDTGSSIAEKRPSGASKTGVAGFDINSLSRTIDELNNNLGGLRKRENEEKEKQEDIGVDDYIQGASESDKNEKVKTDNKVLDKFEREFTEIKTTLNKLMGDKTTEKNEHFQNFEKNDLIIKNYMDILKNNDFDSEECNDIINEVKNSISKEDLKDKYKIEKSLKDLLKSRIITTGPIKTGTRKKIIMYIGPTGVGKTTTMAKLGAIYSLREGKKVTFITLDNYRIAATEQLKKYAEIMRIPVHAVNNQKEFKDLLAKEKADIIMVDTSGRSHRNELKISEIKSFADQVDYDIEKILCVSANTKKSDLNDVFKAFDVINFNSVVITKVDETSFLGNVVNVADKYNKPIAYYTNGQEVPNDIVVADPDKIVDMMVGNMNN